MRLLIRRLGVPAVALLVAGLSFGGVAASPHAASAATPTATVKPSTIAPGGHVTISGGGFGVREPIFVYLDNTTHHIGALLSLTNGGVASTTVIIPATTPVGAHTVLLVGQRTKTSASASIIVSRAQVTLIPSTLTPGSQVTVSAAGFGPGEQVMVTVQGLSQPLATLMSDANGNVAATKVTIPVALPSGAHLLVLSGHSSQISASAPFTLNPALTATVTPAAITAGGKVTVSGSGFTPHEQVIVSISGMTGQLATITADANGNVPATSVTIPATLAAGAHTLLLSGHSSGHSASAPFTLTVTAAPAITLSATSAHPGQTFVVTGAGFADTDHISLSLNGVVLPTSPSTILVHNGTFRAVVKMPKSLLSGANTISAVGSASHISAAATLTGMLPTRSSFYFAGASTMPGVRASLPMLNTSAQTAHIDLTFYFESGTPGHASLDVPAHSRATADLNALAGLNRRFGVKVSADRMVAPELRLTRDGKDGAAMLPVTAPQTTWYLAEGFTGNSFHETISLANPGSVGAQVNLRLLPFSGRAPRTVTVYVAPQSTRLVDVNALMPNQSLSVIADASAPIVVERTLTFSTDGYGMTAKTGVNAPATSWIFAAGKTNALYRTYLTVLNPGTDGTMLTANFYGQGGALLGSRTIRVDSQRRANINLNHYLMAGGISIVVSSDRPVVVERPLYTGNPNGANISGSDVFGRNGAGLSWAFPGGNSGTRSDHLLLFNPSHTTAAIDATFYASNGSSYTQRFYVSPMAQYDVNANALAPSLTDTHSVVLRSANGVGIVAEQSLSVTPAMNAMGAIAGTQGFAS